MLTSDTTVFIGDSLTEGGQWSEWFPETRVVNRGTAGQTSDMALSELSAVVEENPDLVVVLIGTNDLVRYKTVEHVVRNIETLLVNIRQKLPEAQILVQSLLPRSPEFADRLHDVNRHLRQFSPSIKAQYLDLWPILSPDGVSLDPAYSEDALHINDAGYAAWLSELKPALEILRNVPPSSRPIHIPRHL